MAGRAADAVAPSRHLAGAARAKYAAVVLGVWLWRGRWLGGRLRHGVTAGLFFGIWMGLWFSVVFPRPAEEAAIGGVISGVFLGTWMAGYVGRSVGMRELWALPRSDRVAVVRAVRRGAPVSDPRLAPTVLAWATSVMDSLRRQRTPTSRLMPFVFAALALVMALVKTSTGTAWQAVIFWAATVMFLGLGWTMPRSVGRLYE